MLVGNLTISIFQHWSDVMWMCDAGHLIIIIIIIIFFNDKLTIATHYKIKDKYKVNNVGLAVESSNTYKNQYNQSTAKSLYPFLSRAVFHRALCSGRSSLSVHLVL